MEINKDWEDRPMQAYCLKCRTKRKMNWLRVRLPLAMVLILALVVFALPAQATDMGEIHPGETRSGSITGPSYMDSWTFEGSMGDRIIVDAEATSGNLDTEIYLYPPGSGPAEADTSPWGDLLDHQLQSSGLYTIIIMDHGVDDAGDYQVTFMKLPGSLTWSEDPDGGEIAPGETLSGTINLSSDMDGFQFYGAQGDRIIVDAEATSGNLDTEIYLYPPGSGPAEADTSPWGDLLDHQLQSSGLYTIIIMDHGVDDAGDYQVALVKIPSTIRPGIYNPFPPNKATIANLGQSFTWDAVEGATDYDLFFGEDVTAPLEKIGENLPSPEMPFPEMVVDKVYYWHVEAYTPSGSIEGSYWWFKTSEAPPSVTTSDATDVGVNSATLNGNLDDLGTASTVHVSFEWGTTSAYGNETTPVTKTSTGAFSANLSGLSPNSTYHFRAKAVGNGTSYGSDKSFTTTFNPMVYDEDGDGVIEIGEVLTAISDYFAGEITITQVLEVIALYFA